MTSDRPHHRPREGSPPGAPALPPARACRGAATAAALLSLLLLGSCSGLPRMVEVDDALTAEEHVDLGLAHEKKGKMEKAEREYRAAVKADGKLYAARYNLGNVLMGQEKYRAARKEYLAALEAKPLAVEAANNLAWASIRAGEGMEEAAEVLEKVLAGPAGRAPALLDTYGFLLVRMGRPKEGTAVLREAEMKCMTDGASCPEATLREIWVHLSEIPLGGGKGAPVAPPGRPGGGTLR